MARAEVDVTKVINTVGDHDAVPSVYSGPGAVIHPVNFQNVAAIQARTYEILTGIGSDGGATEVENPGHDHSEPHNMPHLVLVSRAWGNEGATRNSSERPLSIYNATTNQSGEPIIYVPFFVPDGLDDCALLVVVHCVGEGQSSLRATLATWSGSPATATNVTGSDYITLLPGSEHPALADLPGSHDLRWCRVFPAASGQLHTLKISTDLYDAGTDIDMWWGLREIRSLTVINEPLWVTPPNVTKPDLPTANLIDVGDSRNASYWTCPTDTLYPQNGTGPSHPTVGVRFMALNDAWMQEKAMGLPAGGQATATIDGHLHTGLSGEGAEIQIPVLAFPVGRWSDNSGVKATLLFGNGAEGPESISDTASQVLHFEMNTMDHTYALDSVAHPRLYVAALMYGDTDKNSEAVVTVTTLAGTGDETVATCAMTAGADGYELVTGDVALNFTSAGITDVTVTLATIDAAINVSETCALVGLCFWIST